MTSISCAYNHAFSIVNLKMKCHSVPPHQVHHQHHNTQTGEGDDKLEGEEGVEEGEDKEEDRQGRMEKKDRGEKIISEYNNIIEHEH